MSGNRCPDCNKWVSLTTEEPEVESLEISEDSGEVSATVTISRNCAECDTEMKSMTYEVEETVDEAWREAHESAMAGSKDDWDKHGEWGVEEQNIELSESGGGRYAKNMIGFRLTVSITCKCEATTTLELSAEEPASSFEEV